MVIQKNKLTFLEFVIIECFAVSMAKQLNTHIQTLAITLVLIQMIIARSKITRRFD